MSAKADRVSIIEDAFVPEESCEKFNLVENLPHPASPKFRGGDKKMDF